MWCHLYVESLKKKSKTTNLELVETVEKRLLGDEGNKSFVEEYKL